MYSVFERSFAIGPDDLLFCCYTYNKKIPTDAQLRAYIVVIKSDVSVIFMLSVVVRDLNRDIRMK